MVVAIMFLVLYDNCQFFLFYKRYFCLEFIKVTKVHFMSIKSYLAHPHDGKKSELIEALSNLDNCEVIPAENKDLLILVTDTDDKLEDENLKERIEAIESLKLLAMVSGFDTPKHQ